MKNISLKNSILLKIILVLSVIALAVFGLVFALNVQPQKVVKADADYYTHEFNFYDHGEDGYYIGPGASFDNWLEGEGGELHIEHTYYLYIDGGNYYIGDESNYDEIITVTGIDEDAFNGKHVSSLVIGPGISHIGSSAFETTDLTSVILGEGITVIDDYAFDECLITSITIPASVEIIGLGAFDYCENLEVIEFAPNSHLETINGYAFRGCAIGEIEIPKSVTYIGENVFQECYGLHIVTVPFVGSDPNLEDDAEYSYFYTWFDDGNEDILAGGDYDISEVYVTGNQEGIRIAGNTFTGCTTLIRVYIGDGVKEIGDGAFCNCASLEVFELGNGIEHIGENIFSPDQEIDDITTTYQNGRYIGNDANSYVWLYDLTSNELSSFTIQPTCRIIGAHAFEDCDNLTSITIPASVVEIGAQAFYCSDGLATVNITQNSKLKRIGYSAFETCGSLSSITLPEGLEIIELGAFDEIAITSITIPSTVRTMGEGVFYSCESLETVTFAPNSHLREINNEMFYCCYELANITLPDSIQSIGDHAFYMCNMVSFTVPASVQSIGNGAFEACEMLETLTFAQGSQLTTIAANAFYDCMELTEIVIPASVTSIGSAAFGDCSSLEEITLPFVGLAQNLADNSADRYFYKVFGDSNSSVPTGLSTTILSGRIYPNSMEFSKLVNIVLGEGVTSVGASAINECSSLRTITIGSNVTSIENYGISGCQGLQTITFAPNSHLTTIGTEALSDNAITTISIPNSVTSIGAGALKNCSDLESITLPFVGLTGSGTTNREFYRIFGNNTNSVPEGLTTVTVYGGDIYQHAFSDLGQITTVTLESGVASIGTNSFYLCSNLETITIKHPDITIGDSAFNYCYKITTVNCTKTGDDYTFTNGHLLMANQDVENNPEWQQDNINPLVLSASFVGGGTNVTSIGDYAFYAADNMHSIVIPNTVNSIILEAFGEHRTEEYYTPNNLKNITYTTSGEDWSYVNGTLYLENKNYDEQTWCDYNSDTGIGRIILRVEWEDNGSQVTEIADNLFDTCVNIIDFQFPKGLVTIGDSAFNCCRGLTSVVFPNSLRSIGEDAFYGCTNLAYLQLNNGLETIGGSAFEDCIFTSVTIPDTVTSIGSMAFEGDGTDTLIESIILKPSTLESAFDLPDYNDFNDTEWYWAGGSSAIEEIDSSTLGNYTGYIELRRATLGAFSMFEADFCEADGTVIEQYRGLSMPNIIPEKEGFSFEGWYFNQALTDPAFDVGESLDDDYTFYAKWIQTDLNTGVELPSKTSVIFVSVALAVVAILSVAGIVFCIKRIGYYKKNR